MQKVYRLNVPKKARNYLALTKVVSIDKMSRDLRISKISAKNYLSRAEKLGLGVKAAQKILVQAKREMPEMTLEKKKTVSAIREGMPFMDLAIWSLQDLNKYAHNMVMKNIIFIEAQKDYAKPIQEVLWGKGFNASVLGHSPNIGYLLEILREPVLIIPRNDKSGTIKDSADAHLFISTFEKIIVDIYFLTTRRGLKYPLPELGTAMSNLFRFGYSLNFSLLNQVAMRRHVAEEIKSALYFLKNTHPSFFIPEKYALNRQPDEKRKGFIGEIREGF